MLGTWVRDTTKINGLVVSNSSVDTLKFETGMSHEDTLGVYTTSRPGYRFSSTFGVDVANETLWFGLEDTTGSYWFEVKSDRMKFEFRLGTKDYEELWGRVAE